MANRTSAPKSNQLEMEQRVQQVLTWLSQGMRRSEIIENALKKWKVQPAQVDIYIAKAKDLWQKENDEMRALAAEYAYKKVMATVERTEGKQDKIHLQALDMLIKMSGLYAATKQQNDAGEWRTKAIADIEKGLISYQALEQAFDSQTARELFTLAGRADAIPTA